MWVHLEEFCQGNSTLSPILKLLLLICDRQGLETSENDSQLEYSTQYIGQKPGFQATLILNNWGTLSKLLDFSGS